MEVGPESQDSDGELVARYLRGDGSAFDALVLRHRLAVYRVAYRLLGSHEEADDVSQEAFLERTAPYPASGATPAFAPGSRAS